MFHIPKIDPALGKFSDHDLAQSSEVVRVVRDEHNLVLLLNDFGFGVFEVESSREFLAGLIECVIQLLFINL